MFGDDITHGIKIRRKLFSLYEWSLMSPSHCANGEFSELCLIPVAIDIFSSDTLFIGSFLNTPLTFSMLCSFCVLELLLIYEK